MLLTLPDLAATDHFGRCLGEFLFPGAVVALVGPLGAGKTHLVRAIAEGLEVPDSRIVTSPTFVLIQEYQGRLPIYHFDAYRLPSPSAFEDLGAQELFESNGVCLVEWADRVAASLPAEHLRISLAVVTETSRQALLEAFGKGYEALIGRLGEVEAIKPRR